MTDAFRRESVVSIEVPFVTYADPRLSPWSEEYQFMCGQLFAEGMGWA